MEIENDLINLISEHTGFSPEELGENREFETDLNIAHNELIELISLIEDKFKISIENDHLEEIKTIRDLKVLVLDQLGVIN